MNKNMDKILSGISSYKLIETSFYEDDYKIFQNLVDNLSISSEDKEEIQNLSAAMIEHIRKVGHSTLSIDNLLSTYKLSTKEGKSLMSMAEALIRIPDSETQNALISDKIENQEWAKFISKEKGIFTNLLSTGMLVAEKISNGSKKLKLDAISSPVLRKAILESMSLICKQFVLAKDIPSALKSLVKLEKKGYLFSFDMLGEGARTIADADLYNKNYINSVELIKSNYKIDDDLYSKHGISVKLSALHPQYHFSKKSLSFDEIYARLKNLALHAKEANIVMIIDAEESHRLDFSLQLITKLLFDKDLEGYNGVGLAVQAYQKRALSVVNFLIDLAKEANKKIPIRLVKGAYWDSEIKMSQELGLTTYPVFIRKDLTDLSYFACATKLIQNTDLIYPQFATHNAVTVAGILYLKNKYNKDFSQFEFQRLYGMGEVLFDHILKIYKQARVRIYAPIGNEQELLPYLVRRILENGANSSFVSKINEKDKSVEDLAKLPDIDQIKTKEEFSEYNSKFIVSPRGIFGLERLNSLGYDLSDGFSLQAIENYIKNYKKIEATPLLNGKKLKGNKRKLYNPADLLEEIGELTEANGVDFNDAIDLAYNAYRNPVKPEELSKIIDKISFLLEERMGDFISVLVKEAGKTILDAINEVREAIDFCRYYASLVRKDFVNPLELKSITGEDNKLYYEGKGVFICISPWNFPLAIFMGQVVAALAAGNAVVAKPSNPTSLIAFKAVNLMYEAGLRKDLLSFMPCKGSELDVVLSRNNKIAGVAFTGSTEVAIRINRNLASRSGPIATVIAETGGINAMIVDTTSLIEQVIDTVIKSAFHSAGQRCSALRMLFIQEEIYPTLIEKLKGAMDLLVVGNNDSIVNDVGPVISRDAMRLLEKYEEHLRKSAKLIFKVPVNDKLHGYYYGPAAYEVNSAEDVKEEVFGPILHVIKYKSKELDEVIEQINKKGFGLTFGVHTRISSKQEYLSKHIHAGNIYVNRAITGAVVGSQPFGGHGLSGTGPKAGGPNYLKRFANEKVVSIDTTAAGGNADMLSNVEYS